MTTPTPLPYCPAEVVAMLQQNHPEHMKTIEFRITTNKITVLIDGVVWAVWPRNATTQAIANGHISTPADLNAAARSTRL